MNVHGGQLAKAIKKYGRKKEEWIDLSTGINPEGWPVPSIPAEIFNRLPEDDDGLGEAAQDYYQADNFLPVAGSQAAIECLPKLRNRSIVAIPESGYSEHAYHWKQAGHEIVYYQPDDILQIVQSVDVLVVINPNNPGTETFSVELLLQCHQILANKSGWLVVDEAFIDLYEIQSVVNYSHQQGLIVLRSLGKFFGLAGIRSGFVFAHQDLLDQLRDSIVLWSMTNPTRYISRLALKDSNWKRATVKNLKQISQQFKSVLEKHFSNTVHDAILFKTVYCENSEALFESFANEGLLCRLLDNKTGLRFGLPKRKDISVVDSILIKVMARNKSTHEDCVA